MIRKIIHIMVWVMVAAYLAMALAFTEKMEDAGKVGFIEVEMVDSAEFQFINGDDVLRVLKMHGFKIEGQPVDSINRFIIKEAVKDIPEVKEANVYFTPDNALHIKIWQRRPVVRIISGKMDYYLDEENNPLPFSSRFTPKVLVITGSVDVKLAQEKLFDLAIYIRENSFFNALVQEIYVNPKNQLEIIPRIGRHRILMGEADNYEWKFEKLVAFYEKGLPKLGWNRYSDIDIRYGNQVVCKKIEINSTN